MQLLQVVSGTQVSPHCQVGQVHQEPSFGVEDHQQITKLLLTLGSAREEAVFYQEEGDRQPLIGVLVHPLYLPHLAPAVSQSVILLLLAPKVSLSGDLENHRQDRLRGRRCLT